MKGELGKSFLYVVHNHCLFNNCFSLGKRSWCSFDKSDLTFRGIDLMKKNRTIERLENLIDGPGKPTQTMNLTLAHNRIDVTN